MAEATSQLLRILKMAVEIEKNGLATFKRFADQTKNETGKRIFLRLAKDEEEHRRILEKQMQMLSEGKAWEDIDIPRSEIETIAPTIREKQQRTTGEAGLAELDALKIALDLERKAAQFFREHADATSEQKARALFERLADWEDAHYDLIQAELDSINHTGMWLGMPEFRMDGKY
jgi:rubrerythrin